ncbi:hypothetical protein I3842_12G036600 [Carya illinoinensis]|uniref:Peptidase S26 domain-containing protein n=1 Tax=Carya illinoinensis TaxID=32201 RepID=A0A922IUY9_CARIL|nr:hypothetical protein I3842_12G036600 [Carya illinoinensis]
MDSRFYSGLQRPLLAQEASGVMVLWSEAWVSVLIEASWRRLLLELVFSFVMSSSIRARPRHRDLQVLKWICAGNMILSFGVFLLESFCSSLKLFVQPKPISSLISMFELMIDEFNELSWGFLRWPGLDAFPRLFVVLLLWSTFSEIRHIPSSSMFPTLHVGDRIIVERALYYIVSPDIQDIHLGDEQGVFIKRNVAKARDSVKVNHGLLYVNGIAQRKIL